MIRVHVICEGQTEEMFVNEILSLSLRSRGILPIPSLVGKPGHQGGNLRIERLFTDVRKRLLGDTTAYCTTLFDFYALPKDFPGKSEARKLGKAHEKSNCLLVALTAYLTERLGEEPLRRFIPYVQMHEFEGLLFSDASAFAQGVGQAALADALIKIRGGFDSPEDINDSPNTAPSKRIQRLFPAYDKPLYGSLAALEVGLEAIRRECPLFNEWVRTIEALGLEEKE